MSALADRTMTPSVQERLETLVESEGSGRLRPALRQVVPKLAALLVVTRKQPLDQVRRMVARVLHEHCDIDEGGDAPVHNDQEIETQVDLVMRAADACREAEAVA